MQNLCAKLPPTEEFNEEITLEINTNNILFFDLKVETSKIKIKYILI